MLSARVSGLAEVESGLAELAGAMDDVASDSAKRVATEVADHARPRVPSMSGRARRSIRVETTATGAEVLGGGSKASYYGWLDYGGRVGRGGSIRRPYRSDGRYIFPSFEALRGKAADAMADRLSDEVREAGL